MRSSSGVDYRIEPARSSPRCANIPPCAAAVAIASSPAGRNAWWHYVPQPSAGRADGEPEFWPAVGPYQVYDEFLYDLMSSESRRVEMLPAGLAAVRDPGVVLDIGTGEHALLARLAAEAGARRVYAVEVLEDAAARARAVVARLGLADRITVITGDIADAAVAGAGRAVHPGHHRQHRQCRWHRAAVERRQRWFSPACVPVPTRCRTLIAPVELPNALSRQPAFGALARSYAERVFAAQGGRFDIRLCLRNFAADGLLADPLRFEDLDFSGPVWRWTTRVRPNFASPVTGASTGSCCGPA